MPVKLITGSGPWKPKNSVGLVPQVMTSVPRPWPTSSAICFWAARCTCTLKPPASPRSEATTMTSATEVSPRLAMICWP